MCTGPSAFRFSFVIFGFPSSSFALNRVCLNPSALTIPCSRSLVFNAKKTKENRRPRSEAQTGRQRNAEEPEEPEELEEPEKT